MPLPSRKHCDFENEVTLHFYHCAAKVGRQKGAGNKVTPKKEKGYQKVARNEKKVTKK